MDCQKSCTYSGKDCDDERCDGGFSNQVEKKELKITMAVITNLASFVNYTCIISAKNRVSEVAKRSPSKGVANFTLVNLRTKGSGKPYFVEYV